MTSENLYTKFVEAGRLCIIQYGPNINKVGSANANKTVRPEVDYGFPMLITLSSLQNHYTFPESVAISLFPRS